MNYKKDVFPFNKKIYTSTIQKIHNLFELCSMHGFKKVLNNRLLSLNFWQVALKKLALNATEENAMKTKVTQHRSASKI